MNLRSKYIFHFVKNLLFNAEVYSGTAVFSVASPSSRKRDNFGRAILSTRDSTKEGGGFVHKSALIKNVHRTLTDTHILIDLDELNIFCSRIGYPQRFLEKFYPSQSVVLFHTRGSFCTRLIASLASATGDNLCNTDRTWDALQDHAKR